MDVGTSNYMQVRFEAKSENESLARMIIAAFVANFDPTLEQLSDVKTAVSEAVTNAIVHGYAKSLKQEVVEMICERKGKQLIVTIIDSGCGIEDVEQAMQPFYTTKADMERTGMGFSFMEAFMDEVIVSSKLGEGTRVRMEKVIERADV